MAQSVYDINSTNWQISTGGFGLIAEGLADIRQCLDVLLRTYKGSDNLRPEFGCSIFEYIDKPMNFAVPNMKRSIIEAIAIWETRVKLISITHYINNAQVFFNITYKLVDQDIIDSLLFGANDGVVPPQTGLILQAYYPPNPYGRLYTIDLVLDDATAIPAAPGGGFPTINSLYTWVINNWASYGRWVQLMDRIVLYANNTYTTGSIGISLLAGTIRLESLLPALLEGQQYTIDFAPNGGLPAPAFTGESDNMEAILLWVQSNWGSYGTWSIESGSVDLLGDFSAIDFSADFAITGIDTYYLILNSTTLTSGTLNVSAI